MNWIVTFNKNEAIQVLVAHAYSPSYLRGWNWKDQGSRSAWEKLEKPHLQNNQSKMNWKCGLSSSRVSAFQVWSPRFKPQFYQKKKKKKSQLYMYWYGHIVKKDISKNVFNIPTSVQKNVCVCSYITMFVCFFMDIQLSYSPSDWQ
jgi:hypothetical protein